jgi:phage shock protein PspC (stress-responsive transcriptional regulator)
MTDDPRNNDPSGGETPDEARGADADAPTDRMTAGDPLGDAPERPAGGDSSAGGETPGGGDQPRRLTRSGSNSVIGGVAGGLGRYFNIDPILFRIGFVALSFAGGIGVIAYLALLAFVPSDGEERTGGTSRLAAIAGVVVLGIALLAFLDGPFFFGGGLFFIGVVGLAGYLLWRGFGGATDGDPGRTLVRIILAAVVAVGVVIAAIGVGIAAALGGGVVIASLAVVAGLALIATAFAGGARWLILPALVLVLPLAVVSAADIDFDGGVGDREYRPATMAELDDRYEIGLGEIDVDLRDLELPAGRTDVAVDVGMGGALVWVPREACVTSDVAIGVGAADVLDDDDAGVDVRFATDAVPVSTRPHLHIEADVGVGAVEVVREGFTPDWRDHDMDGDRFFDDGRDERDERGPRELGPREGSLNCA